MSDSSGSVGGNSPEELAPTDPMFGRPDVEPVLSRHKQDENNGRKRRRQHRDLFYQLAEANELFRDNQTLFRSKRELPPVDHTEHHRHDKRKKLSMFARTLAVDKIKQLPKPSDPVERTISRDSGVGNQNMSPPPSTGKNPNQGKFKPTRKHPEMGRFVPIKRIAGNDVFSGVFLKIESASAEHENMLDSLSYGLKMNSTMGNPYICLSTKKSGDDTDPMKQWLFQETEEEGYYILRNKNQPTSYVTWEDEEEQYLVLETRKDENRLFKPGAIYRKNVLFQILPRGKGYEFKILGWKRENTRIVIDPIWASSTGCYVLRRTTRAASAHGDSLDYIFKISRPPSSVTIEGSIENFRYRDNMDSLFQRAKTAGTVMRITSRTVYNHGDHQLKMELEDIHERRDKFSITLSDGLSMSAFDKIYVPPGLGISTPRISTETDLSGNNPSLVLLEKTTGADTVEKFKYKITGDIQVPEWSALQYTVAFAWLEKLKLIFQGDLKIIGRTDRMTRYENPKVVLDQRVDFSYIRDALWEKGFNTDGLKVSKSDAESFTIAVQGTVIAKTLGIKGDIEMSVSPLSSNISVACNKVYNTNSE